MEKGRLQRLGDAPAWPRVAVFGAGAVGCYFGGMLARAGEAVTLIGRARHVDAIRRDGLWIASREFQEAVPVAASTDPAAARDAELVLLCVKTPDTEPAARELAPHLASGAVVASLQNGVDNAARLGAILPNPIVPAVVYVSAEMMGPGRVRHNGRGDLIIGAPRGRPSSGLEAIAATFERASVPCRISTDIDRDLWEKLALNCAFNPVSALGRARYARLIAHEPARALLREVIDEVVAVAAAEGIELPAEELMRAAEALARAVPQAISSTAQDLEVGRPTEIDDLNGFVASRGSALGVPTPVNRALHALVRLIQDGGED